MNPVMSCRVNHLLVDIAHSESVAVSGQLRDPSLDQRQRVRGMSSGHTLGAGGTVGSALGIMIRT